MRLALLIGLLAPLATIRAEDDVVERDKATALAGGSWVWLYVERGPESLLAPIVPRTIRPAGGGEGAARTPGVGRIPLWRG